MSNSTAPLALGLQSQVHVLGPGIAGLFIQGLETGLVIAELCRWFSSTERNESMGFIILVLFVTAVGLSQSGMVFASTWSKYVQKYGQPIIPDWSDYVQPLPTLFIAVPVQTVFIRRCYHIVGKNMYIIAPLVLLLISSIITTLWAITEVIRFEVTISAIAYLHEPEDVGISYHYLLSLVLPSILDVALTCILLHYLMQTMKQVYAAHLRRKVSHLMTVVWQSAIPPTLCTIFLCVLYVQFATARPKKPDFWYSTIQGLIGKLYVLSLFYMINDYGPSPELRSSFVPTLTVPNESYDTYFPDIRHGAPVACDPSLVASDQSSSVHVYAISANTAV